MAEEGIIKNEVSHATNIDIHSSETLKLAEILKDTLRGEIATLVDWEWVIGLLLLSYKNTELETLEKSLEKSYDHTEQ